MAGNDANTKVLLHFDSVTGSTTPDANVGGSGKVWTQTGTARQIAPKFGSGCSGHIGNVSALCAIFVPDSADWHLGSSNFTFEFWFNTKYTGRQFFVSQFASVVSQMQFVIEMGASVPGKIDSNVYAGSAGLAQIVSTNAYNDGNW